MPTREAALRAVAEALNASTDAEAALGAVLPHLSALVGLRTAWVFRFDAGLSQFREVAAAGLPPALAADAARPLRQGTCECQRLFRLGQLERAANIVTCSRLRTAEGDRQDLVRHASVALESAGRPLGILNIAAPGRHRFAPSALALAQAVAGQVSVALDRADLVRAAERRIARLSAAAGAGRELLRARRPGDLWPAAAGAARAVLDAPFGAVVQAGRVRAKSEGAFQAHPGARPVRERPGSGPMLWSVHGPAVRLGARSGVRQPLGLEGLVLVVESDRPGAFDGADLEALGEVAAHLRLALAAIAAHQGARDEAAARERRRIAADLHDAVSQRLFAATLALARARALVDGEAPRAQVRDAVARTAENLADAQSEMRALVHALGPAPGDDLAADLRRLVARLGEDAAPALLLRPVGALPRVSGEVREAIVRVAQEALHNALRHARAERVAVGLRPLAEGARLRLTVDDDGVGMPRAGTARPGMGLASMAERAARVGGRLALERRRGGGTRVRLEVPLDPTARGERP
jgi:signal transduction histidine kinase